MSSQVLVPAAAHTRIADALDDLSPAVQPLLWSPDGVVDTDGNPVADVAPEVAWVAIDLLFSGDLPAYVDTLLAPGTVQWVQGCLAGTDGPPFQRILGAGCRLSSSDAPNAGVAEYVMSTVLHTVHGGTARTDAHRERRWHQAPWREINGMTWAVIGFGSIGGQLATRARAFGVEVIGVRRTAVTDDRANRMATLAELPAVLAEADVVVLACPLTDETRGLADAEFFRAMRPDAMLVNVARGPVVDDQALLAALDAGELERAILDVFDVEPLPDDSPLWQHPGLVITSHVAGAGSGIIPRGDAVFLEHLEDYLAGRPLRLEVR